MELSLLLMTLIPSYVSFSNSPVEENFLLYFSNNDVTDFAAFQELRSFVLLLSSTSYDNKMVYRVYVIPQII